MSGSYKKVEPDEIAAFLCGQADKETHGRVVEELNDPGSEFNRLLQSYGEFPPSPLDLAVGPTFGAIQEPEENDEKKGRPGREVGDSVQPPEVIHAKGDSTRETLQQLIDENHTDEATQRLMSALATAAERLEGADPGTSITLHQFTQIVASRDPREIIAPQQSRLGGSWSRRTQWAAIGLGGLLAITAALFGLIAHEEHSDLKKLGEAMALAHNTFQTFEVALVPYEMPDGGIRPDHFISIRGGDPAIFERPIYFRAIVFSDDAKTIKKVSDWAIFDPRNPKAFRIEGIDEIQLIAQGRAFGGNVDERALEALRETEADASLLTGVYVKVRNDANANYYFYREDAKTGRRMGGLSVVPTTVSQAFKRKHESFEPLEHSPEEID